MSDGITLRPWQPGDEAGILRGHNLTFQPSRSLAHWQWKVRHNPTGQVHTILPVQDTEDVVCASSVGMATGTLPLRARPRKST